MSHGYSWMCRWTFGNTLLGIKTPRDEVTENCYSRQVGTSGKHRDMVTQVHIIQEHENVRVEDYF